MTTAFLFGKLREHELEMNRLFVLENEDKHGKNIALKTTGHRRYQDSSSSSFLASSSLNLSISAWSSMFLLDNFKASMDFSIRRALASFWDRWSSLWSLVISCLRPPTCCESSATLWDSSLADLSTLSAWKWLSSLQLRPSPVASQPAPPSDLPLGSPTFPWPWWAVGSSRGRKGHPS